MTIVGPDTAAALLLAAGDNPHRLTGEGPVVGEPESVAAISSQI